MAQLATLFCLALAQSEIFWGEVDELSTALHNSKIVGIPLLAKKLHLEDYKFKKYLDISCFILI